MTCPAPLDVDRLVAYWLGEIPGPEAAAIEEHWFGCAHCSNRLEALTALAAGVRESVRRGDLGIVVSGRFVESLRRAGLQLREYRLGPGERVNCTIRADDAAVVSRLHAPLAGVERVDVVSTSDGGSTEFRIADVPFDPSSGELILIPSTSWLRTMPAFTQNTRLIAVGDSGETTIGEYTFVHSPG